MMMDGFRIGPLGLAKWRNPFLVTDMRSSFFLSFSVFFNRHYKQQPIIVVHIHMLLAQLASVRNTQRHSHLDKKMSGIFETKLLGCQILLNKKLHISLPFRVHI